MITYIIITTIIKKVKERKEREELKKDWENKTGVYWYLNSANKEKFEELLKSE